MTKTLSAADLAHGRATKAIREAQDEPVLICDDGRPLAWLVSADEVMRVAQARGLEPRVYERALELLAVDLYRHTTLTLGQAAKLAGLPLPDFIDLCGALHVPILWDGAGGPAADLNAAERIAGRHEPHA